MLFLDKDHALDRIVALSQELTLRVPDDYRMPARRPLLQDLRGEPVAASRVARVEPSTARAA